MVDSRLILDASRSLNALAKARSQSNDSEAAEALFRQAADLELASPELQNCWGGPFNGQTGRQALVDDLLHILNPAAVIETGTFRGITTEWLADNYSGPVLTCEKEMLYYLQAKARLSSRRNVKLHLQDSRLFLTEILPTLPETAILLFYLDAHWDSDLPLKEELRIIFASDRNVVVLVDDFRVPDDSGYGWDDYGPGKSLQLALIDDVIPVTSKVFYPSMRSAEETGAVRGCCVIASGSVTSVATSEFLRGASWASDQITPAVDGTDAEKAQLSVPERVPAEAPELRAWHEMPSKSLKIALLDAFPLKPFVAEREFIARCIAVFERLGHQAISVSTSREIVQYGPDIVFSTHEFAPKLTEHFTIGLLWSPTPFYKHDPERLRSIRSWDLVVPAGETTRQFAVDLHFPMRHRSAVSEHILYPSAPILAMELPSAPKLSLAYIGVHWDGGRHEDLFRRLAKEVDLHVYGPKVAWKHLPGAYRGPLPFDGKAVFDTLNRHGVVLALHKEEHRREGIPSMRPFEACAAKCLVITDPMPCFEGIFGHNFSYVDIETGTEHAIARIKAVIDAANRDRLKTAARIKAAHELFCQHCSLDALLPRIIEEAKQKIRQQRSATVVARCAPTITVITRCGNRPLKMISRAVESIMRQLYPRISLIFVRFAPIGSFDQYVGDLRASNRFDDIEVLDVGGRGRRSESLWTGLRAVRTPFFAILDDDDEWMPDHLHHLMEILERYDTIDLVYSGTIRQDEEGHSPVLNSRLMRPNGSYVDEQRALIFCEAQDTSRLTGWHNVIVPHSLVARSKLLVDEVLVDPELDIEEDIYLYQLLIARGAGFAFNGRATAIWNWRTRSKDNSVFEYDSAHKRAQSARRIERLEQYRHRFSETPGMIDADRITLLREIVAILTSTDWQVTAPLRAVSRLMGSPPTDYAGIWDLDKECLARLVAALLQSTSWRITAPLRRLRGEN